MTTKPSTDLEQKQPSPAPENEQLEAAESPSGETGVDQTSTGSDDINGASVTDGEHEALAALWASNAERQTAELTLPENGADLEQVPAPTDAARPGPVEAVTEPVMETPIEQSIETDLTPADEIVEVPTAVPDSAEPEVTDLIVEPTIEPSAIINDATQIEPETESQEIEAAIAEAVDVAAAPPAENVMDDPTGASPEIVDAVPSPDVEPIAEMADTVAQDGETSHEEVQAMAPVEKPAPEQVHDEASDQKLIAEVEAAPHKVYLLNKVRKAVAAAGESERAASLRAVEADILAEIETRRSAKEALCERAEALKDSTAWRVTGDAFKALFDEWRKVGAAGRELDDQLWARFNLSRGAFNDRRSKHFEEREVVWSANREQKEALCAEAEALAESTVWKATADAIRDLQARWKAIGSAGREKDEALWARFSTAKQKFFDHRTAAWEENRKRKESLVIDAETLKDSTDWRTTGDAMKAMQTEWKNVGPAGREHEDELWSRFRAATQVFFDRRSSIFADRNQAERENSAKKTDLCVQAEALLYTGDALSAARVAKALQAMWKEIGPVPREQSELLWSRFREVCDKIFANASGERDRQQNEWHVRMREAMTRKREQLSSLRESIAHDEANIERWRESLSTLKPGGKSEEIGKSLEDKIIDVMARIREKQERAEDLKSSISDIEAKLKE